jgi:alcohol dehydrogenase class IV
MMSIASVLGGTVIGGEKYKQTGGPHLNSFSWASFLDHGKATGLMLPYYIVYYAKNPKVVEKLKVIAKILHVKVSENIGRDVAQAMLDWYKSMGFPTKLKDFKGWEDKYIEKALTDAAQNSMKLQGMPNPVPLEKVNEILRPILEAARDGDLSIIK